MKTKHAIGITINGNEVRAAFLSLVRGKARIKALESITLDQPIDHAHSEDKAEPEALNDLENAFDINEPRTSQAEEPEVSKSNDAAQNVSKVYALLDKFNNMKANVAINAPHLTVKYDFIEKQQAPKKKNRLKSKMDIWGQEGEGEGEDDAHGTKYLNASDDKTLMVDYEYHPPVIELMEEVNQFRSNNLNLVLMDTNELALVDLVKEIYKFDKDEITAIVYIEQDFSRVIFLNGKDIFHITPTLHKGSLSKDVLEVLYSRIIFAQDHYFIPEINKILVAGHSSRLKAKYYFRQKFPSALTGYLNSRKIPSDLRFKDRGLLFSRYAVPIALAWKALIKNAVKSKDSNFLPEYIRDRQTVPRLAVHGYLLLFLITSSALLFTWALVSKNLEIRKVTRRVEVMQQQVDNNKALTDRVHTYDGQIIDIERKIALVDSFSISYGETISFLQLLNKEVHGARDIWITEMKKTGPKVNITGVAQKRAKIPIIANAIGGADLKKVTRSEFLGASVFTFHLEKHLDETDANKNLTIFSFLKNRNSEKNPAKKSRPLQAELPKRGSNGSTNGHLDKSRLPTNSANKKSNTKSTAVAADTYVYGLKVGTYDTSAQATAAGTSFREKGYKTTVSPITQDGKTTRYALIIGTFGTIKEAQKTSETFAIQARIKNKVVRFKKAG